MSFLTNSGVGRDTICSKDDGFQIAGSIPTGNLTDLTNRVGWAPKCVFSMVIGVSGLLAEFESRRAATVLGLLLFLGGFPSEDKIKNEGLTTLFLNFWNFDPYQCHGGGVNSGFKIVQICIFWCQHRWG